MPVNITLFTPTWAWGCVGASHGCLKCTLNVVFETLSCGTCGRVSFFFSTMAELETILQWFASCPWEQDRAWGLLNSSPLSPPPQVILYLHLRWVKEKCPLPTVTFYLWQPASSGLPISQNIALTSIIFGGPWQSSHSSLTGFPEAKCLWMPLQDHPVVVYCVWLINSWSFAV